MKPNTEFKIRFGIRVISFISMIVVPFVLACVKKEPNFALLMFVAMFIGGILLTTSGGVSKRSDT